MQNRRLFQLNYPDISGRPGVFVISFIMLFSLVSANARTNNQMVAKISFDFYVKNQKKFSFGAQIPKVKQERDLANQSGETKREIAVMSSIDADD